MRQKLGQPNKRFASIQPQNNTPAVYFNIITDYKYNIGYKLYIKINLFSQVTFSNNNKIPLNKSDYKKIYFFK